MVSGSVLTLALILVHLKTEAIHESDPAIPPRCRTLRILAR